jgi:hypothetical protein
MTHFNSNDVHIQILLRDVIDVYDHDDVINQNIIFQAISRYEACIIKPTHPYLQLVHSNTLENWIIYFKIDNNIYSKGTERLYTWLTLFNYPRLLSLSHDLRYFVLSSLIILFQIYGDGNHRTASYFYNKYTGRIFNQELVSNFSIEFVCLTRTNINDIIEKLISLAHEN